MKPQRELFEIAVYRLPLEAWLDDVEERLNRRRDALLRPIGDAVEESDLVRADSIARLTEKVYGWDYNEVIAWVKLVWDGPGPVVKGYMWQVGNPVAKVEDMFHRQYRRGFKPFPFLGGMPVYKVLETWLSPDQSDADIYQDIRDCLNTIVRPDGELPRRHLDLRAFDTIGPLMRWGDLLGLSPRKN